MSTSADTPARSLRDPFAESSSPSAYDAIAELFLGGASQPMPVAEPAPHRAQPSPQTFPPIEALILGHLPGAASPWASQYAAAVAEREGRPVGLIRLTEDETSVELIGAISDRPMASSLREALDMLRSECSRVMLRSDQSHEAASGIDAAVLLSGADEAAVVAAYRTIKQLATSGPQWRTMRFRTAIMGADAIEADRARQHLRQAVTTFLENRLEDAPSVQRLGPVARTTLYRTASTTPISAIIDEAHRAPSAMIETPTTSKPEPAPATHAAPATPPAPEPRRSEPAPRFNSLAGRISGLTLLETRCPYHEIVELAVDANGRLNLLVAGGVERFGDLMGAEAWSRDHRSLLRKAEPALCDGQAPQLHLFTETPAAVRALLGSSVRIHVLAEAGADGYVCLPLNH